MSGYTVLTPEAAVSAAPDAIVVPARSLELMGGLDALCAHPGLALTPAVKTGRIIALDDLLLLGFGPRTGQAARLLAGKLDPHLTLPEPMRLEPARPEDESSAR
jgi:iron complex transport system substrate-binding protein